MTRRILLSIAGLIIFAGSLYLTSPSALAASSSDMIDDNIFDNTTTMTAASIDAWLNANFPQSCISTNSGFTAPDPTGYTPTSSDANGIYTYGSPVSAGTVIMHAAQGQQINPQVLLTKLQNEEGLVRGDGPYGCGALAISASVGFACTDSGTASHTYSYPNGGLVTPLYYRNGTAVNSVTNTCVNTGYFTGFSEQVVHAAWLLSWARHHSEGQTGWAAINGNWNHCDDNNTCPASMNIPASWSCYSHLMTQGYFKRCPTDTQSIYYDGYASIDGQSIHMDTGGTAALYVYTPHIQSFDSIFTPWFGSPTGSVLFKVGDSPTYYLEWGSYYYPIPSEAILYDYGLESIAPRTISTLPSNETQGPLLTNAAKFGSDNSSDPDYTATVDLVEGGQKHDVPNWTTLNAFGVNSYTAYPASLQWALENGDALRPVVRKPNGTIYLIQNDKKRGFPDWNTFSTLSGPDYTGTNQIYSQQSLTNMSSSYVDSIDVGAPMLLDGKTVKSSTSAGIYLYDNNKKYGFSAATYAAWGGGLDYVFSQGEIDQIADGGAAPLLTSSISGTKYVVDNGDKKSFAAALETAWGFNDSQFTQMTDSALSRLQSTTASNLVTTGAGVYYIDGGARHGVGSLSDFNKLGFSWSNVDTISSNTLALVPPGATLYAPGSLVRTPNGATFVVNSNYAVLGITSGDLFSRFGLSWSNVLNIPASGLNGYSETGLQTLLKDNSSSNYYEVDQGVKRFVDSSTYSSSQYNMAAWPFSAVDPGVISTINSGPQLTRFIRGNSSPTVYYIQNGQKCGIPTESKFYSLGGTWGQVVNVSDEFLSEIPTGPVM